MYVGIIVTCGMWYQHVVHHAAACAHLSVVAYLSDGKYNTVTERPQLNTCLWQICIRLFWMYRCLCVVRPALPLTTELWNVRSGLLHRLVSLIATTLILRLPFTFNIPVLSSSDVIVYLLIDSMCSGCHSQCLAYSYVYKLGLIL